MPQRRRVAVVGAGPSGLFAANALTQSSDVACHVDIYDRLPTPYGLLRYGVAPDHTSIKGVATALAKVFESPDISFLGLVELGRDLTREELLTAYDAVIYAVGASEDMHMGIPGEDLPGAVGAREFVAWYSGHPDARPQSLAGVTSAVTVGVGNVAVDVARILSKPVEGLAETDMPREVLAELASASITDVWIIGRRGPQHASFTTVELRELLSLPNVQPVIEEGAFDGIDDGVLDRRTAANVAALRDATERHVPDETHRLHLLFWHRPVEITGEEAVEGIVCEQTTLDDSGRVVGTGELRRIDTQLVLRAIGYRGTPIAGLPFDTERCVVPSVGGRVIGPDGEPLPREYVVGWIKRGPIGVIGTNKSDAAETVANVFCDLRATPPRSLAALDEIWRRRGLRPSTFADWQRIEDAEADLGAEHGVAVTKIHAWRELLDIARMGQAGGPETPGDQR